MAAKIRYDDVEVGSPIAPREFTLLRVQLLRFCSACSDYTGTHWNERIAKSVGLPDVIAHGTLTIAEAVRLVSDWLGDPGAIVHYEGMFSRPVVVPDDDVGTVLRVSGTVQEKLGNRRVLLHLAVQCREDKVVSGARVIACLS